MTHHGINLLSSAPHTTLSPTFYRDSNLSLSLDNQSPFSISVKQKNNFLLRSPSLCYRSYTFTGNVFERVKFLDLSPSPSAFLPAVVPDRPLREMQNWRSASDGNHPLSSSQRDVTYRCGSCGYELNLSSSGRNTSTIGSKYGKSIKRGIISFFYIDENRFTQVEELQCMPYISKRSWGLFRRRTKLLCRKCENLIGTAYDNPMPSYQFVSDGSDSASGSEISSNRKYDVRIRALQPSSSEEVAVPLTL